MPPSPPDRLSRRNFLRAASALGGALAAPGLATAAAVPPRPRKAAIKLGLDIQLGAGSYMRDSGVMLVFARQLGLEWIATPLRASQGDPVPPRLDRGIVRVGNGGANVGLGGGLGGPSGPWKEEEVRAIVDRAAAAGMRIGDLGLHNIPNVLLGNPERDRDIEHVRESIRIAGRLGIPVIQYGFSPMAAVDGLYSLPGRGGATYRAYDNARIPDQTPYPGMDPADGEAMWERLSYFIKAILPAAEEAGVRLALHPNDPPPPAYRGVAQPFASIEHWKRLVNYLPSPFNGIVLETGVTTELGGDVVETIRYFGGRNCINHVHFRNVRTRTPALKYAEAFIDEGQADLLAAMRALVEVGYAGMIVPDHTPQMSNDAHQFGAWGYTLGYIRGLLRAAEAA